MVASGEPEECDAAEHAQCFGAEAAEVTELRAGVVSHSQLAIVVLTPAIRLVVGRAQPAGVAEVDFHLAETEPAGDGRRRVTLGGGPVSHGGDLVVAPAVGLEASGYAAG